MQKEVSCLELRHLRYFIAVAEELHFGRAANRLNMAQPPLSQQIRQLEDELSVPLFYRTKHHVQLTDAGRAFLEHAYQILEQVRTASDTARRVHRGETGQLHIGFTGTVMYDIFPQILHSYRAKYPFVNVMLHQLSTMEQVKALEDKKIHIGVLCTPVENTSLQFRVIHQQPFVVALPIAHPLASGNSPCNVSELAKELFIMTPRKTGHSYYDLFISICYQAGFSPQVTMEAGELQTVISLVAAGVGVALVPFSVKRLHIEGVVYREIEETGLTVETSIAWREDETSPVVHSFLTLTET